MTSYIDTHCHLDLLSEPARTLDDSVDTVVVAVTELPSIYRLLHVRFRRDKRVRVALGLHPLRAASAGRLEEGQLVRLLRTTEYVGEVGLDFSVHGRESKVSQLRVFDRLLAEPALRHKVVSVHSRGAEALTIVRLRDAKVAAILHWYTGPLGLVHDALSAGLFFSINPAMLRTDKGRKLIAMLPSNRLLTESDGPFAKANDHAAGPEDMKWLVNEVASIRRVKPEDLRKCVYDNLAELYGATVGTGT